MLLSWPNFQLQHDSLSPPKTVICKVSLLPLPCRCFFLCVKLAVTCFSLQMMELFYRCGVKQWGQVRALWWHRCIFTPCKWMEPHIPWRRALLWMAALAQLFSLLVTAWCIFFSFSVDFVIYLYSSSEQNPPLTVKLLDSSEGNVSWRNNTFCQNAAPCCQDLLKKELTEQKELKFYGNFQEQQFWRTFKRSRGVLGEIVC